MRNQVEQLNEIVLKHCKRADLQRLGLPKEGVASKRVAAFLGEALDGDPERGDIMKAAEHGEFRLLYMTETMLINQWVKHLHSLYENGKLFSIVVDGTSAHLETMCPVAVDRRFALLTPTC